MSVLVSADVGSSTDVTVQITIPDGGSTPTGSVYFLLEQTPGVQNPPTKNFSDQSTSTGTVDKGVAAGNLSMSVATLTIPVIPADTYNFYAAYSGTQVTSQGLAASCLAPPQNNGLTPAISSSSSQMTISSLSANNVHSSAVGDVGEAVECGVLAKLVLTIPTKAPKKDPKIAILDGLLYEAEHWQAQVREWAGSDAGQCGFSH
jgi:hypothetical protein